MRHAIFRRIGTGLGFTIVEVLVGSVVVLIIAMAMIKSLAGLVDLSRTTRRQNEAADLTKEITAQIQALPFDQVYALDTDNKSPGYQICPATNPATNESSNPDTNTFNPRKYLLKWDISPSASILYRLEELVKEKGYKGFKVSVTHMRRRRANEDNTSSTIVWNDLNHRSGATTWDGCDDDDSILCWVDSDGDGQYYSVGEPPQTGIKELETTLIDRDGRVVGRNRAVLTKNRLTGSEVADGGSLLTMKVLVPGSWSQIVRATPNLKPHLEFPAFWGFGTTLFDPTTGGSWHVWRADYEPGDLVLNLTDPCCEPWGARLGSVTVSGLDPLHQFKLELYTEPCGDLEVYLVGSLVPGQDPNHPNVGTTPTLVLPLDRQMNTPRADHFIFHKDNGFGPVVAALANLPKGGYYRIYLRKRLGSQFSPWYHRSMCVDLNPPVVVNAPPGGAFNAGQTPEIRISAKEWDDPDTYCFYSYIRHNRAVLRINSPSLPPGVVAYAGSTGPYSITYSDKAEVAARSANPWYTGTLIFRLVDDADYLPARLPAGTYNFQFEFCDSVPLWSTYTWQNIFSENPSDILGPDILVENDSGATLPGVLYQKLGGQQAVSNGVPLDFTSVKISDNPDGVGGNGSGVQWKTFDIHDCEEDPASPGSCGASYEVVFSSNVYPPGKKFGDYFNFGLPNNPVTSINSSIKYNFPHIGNRVIRIRAKDWRDNPSETTFRVFVF
jgi:type II secretory pathway pseudopilin PulG